MSRVEQLFVFNACFLVFLYSFIHDSSDLLANAISFTVAYVEYYNKHLLIICVT